MKRTPWFDATRHQPAREGFYEIRFRLNGSGKFSTPLRQPWRRGEWDFGITGKLFGMVEGDQWRGLASDPDGVSVPPSSVPPSTQKGTS